MYELLRRSQRLAIVGPPESGKRMLGKQLVSYSTQEQLKTRKDEKIPTDNVSNISDFCPFLTIRKITKNGLPSKRSPKVAMENRCFQHSLRCLKIVSANAGM